MSKILNNPLKRILYDFGVALMEADFTLQDSPEEYLFFIEQWYKKELQIDGPEERISRPKE